MAPFSVLLISGTTSSTKYSVEKDLKKHEKPSVELLPWEDCSNKMVPIKVEILVMFDITDD